MNKFVIGSYISGESFVHKIDARIKFLWLFVSIVVILVPLTRIGYFILTLFLLSLVYLSGIRFSLFLRSLKPMLYMAIFIFVMNLFLIQSDEILFQFYFITLSKASLIQSGKIITRLTLLFAYSSLFTMTTRPMSITLALESLLKPLGILKVPYHEIAMIVSIALRFIPVFLEETYRIRSAQISRGIDLKHAPLARKIKGLMAMIVPLFVSALSRAEDLASAMDARGYVPGAKRTRYRKLIINAKDIIFVVIFIAVYTCAIVGGYYAL